MTRLVLDDIIFRLQKFGGASDFWRQLSGQLDSHPGLDITHVNGSKASRTLPIATPTDVVHSSHFRVPLRRSTRCVTTIHDLTYELGMDSGLGRRLNIWQRSNAVKRADAIVCISHHTEVALRDHYADRIPDDAIVTTIHHGRTFVEPTGDELPSRLRGRRPFLLHVGNRSGYKNFATALAAYAASTLPGEGIELWCTGSRFTDDERKAIAMFGLADGTVDDIGLVSTAELGVLYEQAVGLVYPSRYEGFGLPPLDAMSLGCPVVAADASSVREIVDDGGLLVPPDDTAGFSAAYESFLDDDNRRVLIDRGKARSMHFSWERAAAAHADLYRTWDD